MTMKFAQVKRLSPPLDTHDADDGSGLKILDRCLGYRVGNKEYWVECDYGTDFATIPFYARFIARWNKTDDGAVIHDKPFSDGYVYDRYGRKQDVTLWEMNRVFRKIAQYEHEPQGDWFKRTWRSKSRTNPFQAWSLWSGLLAASWIPWRNKPDVNFDEDNVNEWPLKVNPLLCGDEQI